MSTRPIRNTSLSSKTTPSHSAYRQSRNRVSQFNIFTFFFFPTLIQPEQVSTQLYKETDALVVMLQHVPKEHPIPALAANIEHLLEHEFLCRGRSGGVSVAKLHCGSFVAWNELRAQGFNTFQLMRTYAEFPPRAIWDGPNRPLSEAATQ